MEQPTPNSSVILVPSSTDPVLLSSPSTNRPYCCVFNNATTANLYLKLGANPSITSFTLVVAPQGYFETPSKFTGPIWGFWGALDGEALVTELSY
jgi:hypothetical protein